MPATRLLELIEKKLDKIEKYVILFSLFGFIAHIVLIFLVNQVHVLSQFESKIGPNYLYAITTPLNIIVFYEIFCLILALPKSIFVSIRIQMEVVTLIMVRQVFKIIAESPDLISSFKNNDFVIDLALFFGGSLLAFLLTAIFKNLCTPLIQETQRAGRFYIFKSALTLIVIIFLVLFSFYELYIFGMSFFGNTTNFNYIYEFFYVLIFIDVIIFLTAFYYTDDFGVIFIDTFFILAAIILRLGISFEGIYKVSSILSAMVAMVGGSLVYRFLWKGKLNQQSEKLMEKKS